MSKQKEYTGHAGGIPGLVRVILGRDTRAIRVEIDDLVFNKSDKDFISDLFVAALNDAYDKLDADVKEDIGNKIKEAYQKFPTYSFDGTNLSDYEPNK